MHKGPEAAEESDEERGGVRSTFPLVLILGERRPAFGKAAFILGKTETREAHFPILGDRSLAGDMAADIHEHKGNAAPDRSPGRMIGIRTEKAEARVQTDLLCNGTVDANSLIGSAGAGHQRVLLFDYGFAYGFGHGHVLGTAARHRHAGRKHFIGENSLLGRDFAGTAAYRLVPAMVRAGQYPVDAILRGWENCESV